jgi:hypothetical protein
VLIPRGIERVLDYTGCVLLPQIDGEDREWAGKTGGVAFSQAIRSDDCEEIICKSMRPNEI